MQLLARAATSFFDVAQEMVTITRMLLLLVLVVLLGTLSYADTSHGSNCPADTVCVRPLRCTAAMELYWDNLTLATSTTTGGSPFMPSTAAPVLEEIYHRCPIDGTSHWGICCPSSENLQKKASSSQRICDNREEKDGENGLERISDYNDTHYKHNRMFKRSLEDYEPSYDPGLNSSSTGNSFTRTKRCIIGPECTVKDNRYRRFDGECNNIGPGKSLWGSAGYPMERILPPAYGNGVSSPRMISSNGKYLTSCRVISDKLFDDMHVPDQHHNVLMMQFGQFLVHDISRNKKAAKGVSCCLEDDSHRKPNSHPACSPIPVSSKDSFYSQFNVKCMEFVRTKMASRKHCQVGHGRQVSDVTHFIDGSNIYGSSAEDADELRAYRGGRLKSLIHRRTNNEILPVSDGGCNKKAKACFKAGDDRLNQVITLAGVHTLFMREHNRIARALEKINPHWNDEIIFHETRRIVTAQLQHIVYNEYLPKVVGPEFMDMYNLYTSRGYSYFYNPDKIPAITSEFSAAAFRFGHSTIPGQFELPKGIIRTHETYFNPTDLTETSFFDDLFHGIMLQPMERVDDKYTHSITWHLNPKEGHAYGKDLAAINMHQGRDHAIRPYNHYLHLGGRMPKRIFEDYDSHGQKLRSLYPTVEDVDLYVGGILEPPVNGGIVGETFAEIISDQFARLKDGDRYFYSNGPDTNPGHFTPPQLEELQRMTLAGILCANANQKENFEVPVDAMCLPHAASNPIVSCRSQIIPRLNLKWWKD